MKFLKNSRLFNLAVVPMLAAGLFLVLQSDPDKDLTTNPSSPSAPMIITPGDQGIGSPSIIPSDRDTTKIEYRNI